MKTRFLLLATAAGLGTLATAGDVHAAGTALDVQSARGTGMASAVTGFINDSSAIYYNPAGIAQGKGLDAQAGVTLIAPGFKYTSPSGQETSLPFYVVPPLNAYAAYGITDWLSAGIGVFNPFGLVIDWPAGWAGRSLLSHANFTTYDINPTVAVKLLDGRIRIGAGLQIMRATVDLQKDISFGSQFAHTELGGGAWGVGGNAGVQIEAIQKYLLIGATYRSAVKTSFDNGQAHFEGVPQAFQSQIHDQGVSTSITNPDQIGIALASHPIDDLVIDAEIVYLGWAKFRSIDINFKDSPQLSSSERKDWSNTVNYHLGGEYKVHNNWRVRAGAMYDPTPGPSNTLLPDVPDASRLNLAAGGSYVHDSGFHVDLGYQFLVLFKNTSDAPAFPGSYGGNVNILGINVGYTQPKKKEETEPPPPGYESEPTPPPAETAPSTPPPATETPAPAPTDTTTPPAQ